MAMSVMELEPIQVEETAMEMVTARIQDKVVMETIRVQKPIQMETEIQMVMVTGITKHKLLQHQNPMWLVLKIPLPPRNKLIQHRKTP